MTATDELLSKIGKEKYFSKINHTKGHWQIPVANEYIDKTAFVTQDGHNEFLEMPFGLINAGATLVKGLRKLLLDLLYVDYIIHTENWN